jgi:hypothetical protein
MASSQVRRDGRTRNHFQPQMVFVASSFSEFNRNIFPKHGGIMQDVQHVFYVSVGLRSEKHSLAGRFQSLQPLLDFKCFQRKSLRAPPIAYDFSAFACSQALWIDALASAQVCSVAQPVPGNRTGECARIVDPQPHSLCRSHSFGFRSKLLLGADTLGFAGLPFVKTENPSLSS